MDLTKWSDLELNVIELHIKQERERRRAAAVNKAHFMSLGLNGGEYIALPEDRENYLLNEIGRLSGKEPINAP